MDDKSKRAVLEAVANREMNVEEAFRRLWPTPTQSFNKARYMVCTEKKTQSDLRLEFGASFGVKLWCLVQFYIMFPNLREVIATERVVRMAQAAVIEEFWLRSKPETLFALNIHHAKKPCLELLTERELADYLDYVSAQ